MNNTRPENLFFDNFYRRNYQRFYKFAYSYVRQNDIAQDIVGDSFLLFLDRLPSLDSASNFEAYCLTIVKNQCLDYLRQQELHHRAIETIQSTTLWTLQMDIASLEACDPSDLFLKEIKTIVEEALVDLGSRTSEIFTLSRLKNKSHKEIAKELSISVKGVEYHTAKALSLIRKRLKDYFLKE